MVSLEVDSILCMGQADFISQLGESCLKTSLLLVVLVGLSLGSWFHQSSCTPQMLLVFVMNLLVIMEPVNEGRSYAGQFNAISMDRA